MLEGEALEEVDEFTYLGSLINKQEGTDAGVRARIGKAGHKGPVHHNKDQDL